VSAKGPKPKGSKAAPSATPPGEAKKQTPAQNPWRWEDTLKQPKAKAKAQQAKAKAKAPKRVKPATRPISGIQQTPGVCGGDPCIRKTRIPVWSLARGRQLGMTEAELLDSYPSLQAQDLVNAWAYVKAHRDEIERQILENESA
jgi:uncharacterized protein (DUF433 family)